MPPDLPLVKDETPLFEDYLNSAFPCDDLFFNAKIDDVDGSPLLRTYSEDNAVSSSPESSHSCSSKDDSLHEADSDVSLAIKISNNSSDVALAKKKKTKKTADCLAAVPPMVKLPSPSRDTVQESPYRKPSGSVDARGNDMLNYQLNLHGIPSKSRVETQIRLGVQVVQVVTEGSALRETAIGDRFKWLKLPSWAMAKEKLKLQNRRDAPPTIDPNRIIFLDARVVKSTEPLEDVAICAGCVIRERKRAQRKKEPPKRNASSAGGEPVATQEQSELLPLPDEERKILVFNCPELLEIANGEVMIPTRVTCYCRHHKEKDGFRIIITLRDALNNVLASTSSELVLITDDHKTTGKVQRIKEQSTNSVKGRPFNILSTSSSSIKPDEDKSLCANDNSLKQQSQAVSAMPLSRRSSISSTTTTSKKRKADSHIHMTSQQQNSSTGTNSKLQRLPNSLSMTNICQSDFATPVPGSRVHSRMASPIGSTRHVERSPSQDSLFNFMNSSAEQHAIGTRMHSPVQSASIANSISSPEHGFFDTSMDELMHDRNLSMSPRTRTWDYIMDNASTSQAVNSDRQSSIIMPPTAPQNTTQAISPVISRMIPAEGPLQGGTEVTILGNGFYPGMTAMFGDAAAVPTHCWSSTTLVCVLPPATNAGPVPVTFKEHPYSVGAKMFTYMDETDRALFELALQVIGLKTTGRLETARDVAMRICSSKMPSESVDTNMSALPLHRLRTALGLPEGPSDTEELVRRCLLYLHEIDTDGPTRLSLRSKSGHTMLHLAIMKNYYGLVSDLLIGGCNVNIRDRTSFTALHTAALGGDYTMCKLLLAGGSSNVSMCTSDGRTAYDIATMHDDEELLEILDPWIGSSQRLTSHSVRTSRSNSLGSWQHDASSPSTPTSEISQASFEARFARSLVMSDNSHDRPILSRSSGTRTQPASRAQSPIGRMSVSEGPSERRRSRSVNNLSLADLSRGDLQALYEESKVSHPTGDSSVPLDAQTVMHNLLQLQQTWMAFLSETSPLWLQKTLANANASLPEVLKTSPNSLVQHMHLTSSPIATFHAMLPNMPQIRPLTRSTSHEGPQSRSAIKATPATDPGWLQNLVVSLGAPPSYAEAVSSVATGASGSGPAQGTMTEAASGLHAATDAPRRPDLPTVDEDRWFGRSLSMPFRSQCRIAEMTPEQQRAQVKRFQKPADKMMFFFWLPCLLFFIAMSIGKAFVDKVFDIVY